MVSINSVGLNSYINTLSAGKCSSKNAPVAFKGAQKNSETIFGVNTGISINSTHLAPLELEKYNAIVKSFAGTEENTSPQDNVTRAKKLDVLLKSGTLLNNKSNDSSSVLDNLYKTITEPRAAGMSGVKIAGQIIDTLYSPSIINQTFGDIPKEAQVFVVDENNNPITDEKMHVDASGTCVAASVEFHMANKQPAEFARWAESLTSPKVSVDKAIDFKALSKNPMDAIWLLKEFGTQVKQFDFNKANLTIKPDENAIVRAQIQDNFWDKGERSVLDVLFQSTLMQLGSQQSYNTLTDIRAGKFNSNPQGLIEFEKTFIESIVKNEESTSIVYQNVDNDQNLVGWNCDLETIKKHIVTSLDNNEDVIIGYVLTAEECGEKGVNPKKIVNGHEITIVDYKKDSNGKLIFVCNDTDDDDPNYIEYKEDYILPKIHHAGYPVKLFGEDPLKKAV